MTTPANANEHSQPGPPGGGRRGRSVRRWGCVAALVVVTGAGLLFYRAIQNAREDARRSNCKGQLKQIGLALLNYREIYGRFPPPYLADASGRPAHSWRVLILPFLGAEPLYGSYRFDEPWDGPHNSKLADGILLHKDYSPLHCPSDKPESGKLNPLMTSFLAVVGPGTVWQEGKSVKQRDVTDDPDATLLVVEVANSGVHWMEPRDLHILQMAPTIN